MDREKAMKCEEVLARRKQEKYFQLVDEIQNVLRRIEVWKYFGPCVAFGICANLRKKSLGPNN